MNTIKAINEVLNSCQERISTILNVPVKVSYQVIKTNISDHILLKTVCDICCVDVIQVLTKRRDHSLVTARQLFCYFNTQYEGRTKVHTGNVLGRDHTSVIHSIQVVNDMIKTGNTEYQYFINIIKETVYGKS